MLFGSSRGVSQHSLNLIPAGRRKLQTDGAPRCIRRFLSLPFVSTADAAALPCCSLPRGFQSPGGDDPSFPYEQRRVRGGGDWIGENSRFRRASDRDDPEEGSRAQAESDRRHHPHAHEVRHSARLSLA